MGSKHGVRPHGKIAREANGRFAEADAGGGNGSPENNNLQETLNDVKMKLSKAREYSNVTKALHDNGFIFDYERVYEPVPIKIVDPGKHGQKQLEKRGITIEDAQSYVDSAIVMIKQSADKYMFIADDGSAAVIDNGCLSTAFPASWYDERQKEKIEVIKQCLKK